MFKSIILPIASPLLVFLVAALGAPSVPALGSSPVQSQFAAPAAVIQTAPTPKAAVPPALQPLADAFTKTGAATVFKLREDLSGNPLLMPGPASGPADQQVTVLHSEGEFNGKDYHVQLRGTFAALFADDAAKGFEMTQVGGVAYVHGPASALNAPQDQWYQVDASTQMSMSFTPFDTLSKIAGANNGWTRFSKTRSGDALDGLKCDLYSAGTSAAADVYTTLAGGMMPPDRVPVVDQGTVNISVCGDGYVHSLVADFTAHDRTAPDKKGTAKYSLNLNGFDSRVAITAPAGAIALGGTPTPAAKTAPPATTGNVAPNASAGYDGDWEGTTSNDTDISFSVQDNQITNINLSYAVQVGSCSLSGSLSTTPPNTPITPKGLSLKLTGGDKQFTFTATFASNTQANGTLRVQGTTSDCGAIDSQTTWSASRGDTAPTPAASGTSTVPIAPQATDAKSVLTGLFDQLNAKNVDAALAFVGDDPIVTWGSTTLMDKDEVSTFLVKQIGRGITYQVSNVQVVGDTIVNFTVKESGGGSAVYSKSTAILTDGLIDVLTLK